MSDQISDSAPAAPAAPAAQLATEAPPSSPATPVDKTTSEPTTTSNWVRPGYAALVVCLVAVCIVVVLWWALSELAQAKNGTTVMADPNAGTIAAIAATAMSSLTALASAYFGIKFATEQASQANATAEKALAVAGQAIGNSTTNGNPKTEDFGGLG